MTYADPLSNDRRLAALPTPAKGMPYVVGGVKVSPNRPDIAALIARTAASPRLASVSAPLPGNDPTSARARAALASVDAFLAPRPAPSRDERLGRVLSDAHQFLAGRHG